ncbi:hypothetical protein M413DRAFT_32942 [Hebeloma cylindrosporum]|uniref:Uncharacterized protein n=1 Tax=Hebeloma cylindrosporum TaxID=76867 RepID=A0A0C2XA42_HEBCY|nr:hypothetical protein M413DRAFT_32942 [Hebeloma cylindrosporum h7]
MDNIAALAEKPYRAVGAFVTNLTDCDVLFRAGIPVWLVRLAKLAGSVRVDSLVQLQDPREHLCLDDAVRQFPVSFNGSPTDPRKYKVFQEYSRHFLSFGNPFDAGPTSETSVATGSKSLSNLGRSEPGPNVRGSEPPVRSKVNRKQAPYHKPTPGQSDRNKFAEPTSPLMPPAIPTWRSALSHVNSDPGKVVYPITPGDAGYAFPDPGLFVAVTTEEKQTMYFANWLKYREALIYRLAFPSSATTVPNKLWRPLLNLPLNHNPVAPPRLSDKTSLSQKKNDIVYTLLETCFAADDDLTFNPAQMLDIFWQGQPVLSTSVPPVDVAQEILWELYELNFRFEFLALDRRAHIPVGQVDGTSREQLVLACFPGRRSLAVAPINSAREGFGAADWRDRRSSIVAMRMVMKTWRGFTGDQCHLTKGVEELSYTEFCDVKWAVAHFYTQSFFDHFGRAAIVPHTLPVI